MLPVAGRLKTVHFPKQTAARAPAHIQIYNPNTVWEAKLHVQQRKDILDQGFTMTKKNRHHHLNQSSTDQSYRRKRTSGASTSITNEEMFCRLPASLFLWTTCPSLSPKSYLFLHPQPPGLKANPGQWSS